MVNKIFLGLGLIALVLFNLSTTKPKEYQESNALLFVNPWLFKALSGPIHNLIADQLWLMSNSIAEIRHSTLDVDAKTFIEASRSIVIMDPYFYKANNYATTFMTSILDDLNGAIEFLHISQQFDTNNFLLYFNEMLFLMTYSKTEIDYDYIIALAKKAALMPDAKKIVGPMDVSSWIDDILIVANSRLLQKEQAIEDLKWLKTQTKSDKRKKEIQIRIETMQNGQ